MQIIKDFIFIIPARKNSKGIKNKNLIKINNKKLVEYTFDILKNIPENRKYVLTDSKSIKSIARKYQINTSYKRPKILSKDTTELVMNLIHFDNFIGENVSFKNYIILQPTSPLRLKKDIFGAIKKFKKDNCDSLVSVSKSLEHPNDTISIRNKQLVFFNKKKSTLRQSYNESYFINGAIYILKKKNLDERKLISTNKTSIYIMPKDRSIDLDDVEDLKILKKII